MYLYSYIVPFDGGLAPNPFWEYCTLAVCSPNYRGIKAKQGDWLIGISSKKRGNKLIYAMQISETLNLNDYYHDARFLKKRPNLNGTWQEQCGDNFYYLDKRKNWKQAPTHYHKEDGYLEKDTKNPTVFIAQKFYYFGDEAVEIDSKFLSRNFSVRLKKHTSQEFIKDFTNWLTSNFTEGIHGEPFDKQTFSVSPQKDCASCG